jgi:hypothetical protein
MTMNTKEVWKAITNYEGMYEVSSLGRVRSVERRVRHAKGGLAIKRGRVLANHLDSKGYPIVSLCRASQCIKARVHRLVAEAFVPNPRGVPHINHIDGDKANFAIPNLEWVTHQENCRHARDVLNRWTAGYHARTSKRWEARA